VGEKKHPNEPIQFLFGKRGTRRLCLLSVKSTERENRYRLCLDLEKAGGQGLVLAVSIHCQFQVPSGLLFFSADGNEMDGDEMAMTLYALQSAQKIPRHLSKI
jgi:hypothetical protein